MTAVSEFHIALIHYPVVNKQGEIVSTAVTNLDIHDNARSSRTYGATSYHLVTPLDAQVELVTRILAHWREGFGAKRVPNRAEAMELVHVSRTLEEAITAIMDGREGKPIVVSTSARSLESVTTYRDMREQMKNIPGIYLIVFGTGYGLAEAVFEMSDIVLEPIGTPEDWNHLSVRSAVAITLDRLLGDW
jgi:hypothetical protein